MRIIKKIHADSEVATLVSKSFDEVIKKYQLPLNFDRLEFNLDGDTSVEDGKVSVGINNDTLLKDKDSRIIKTLITFELFRVFVRRMLENKIPKDIEDVIISREMIKRGYLEDIVYLFYTYVAENEISGMKSFLKFHLIATTFAGYDDFYAKFFHDIANRKSKRKIDSAFRSFLRAMQQDLLKENNLGKAIELYEAIIHASY